MSKRRPICRRCKSLMKMDRVKMKAYCLGPVCGNVAKIRKEEKRD